MDRFEVPESEALKFPMRRASPALAAVSLFLVAVSTAYVAGTHQGEATETLFTEAVLRPYPDEASARELRDLPGALRAALEQEERVAALAAQWADERLCAVLARGFHYATAREWALKLKELAYLLADPYSGADFQHGPIALVQEGFPILAVATSGPALDGMTELLERVRATGARLLIMSDVAAVRDLAAELAAGIRRGSARGCVASGSVSAQSSGLSRRPWKCSGCGRARTGPCELRYALDDVLDAQPARIQRHGSRRGA